MRGDRCTFCAILLLLAITTGQFRGAWADSGTYWQLAQSTVPVRVEAIFGFMDDGALQPDTGPDDVKSLRIALLRARESLDIFSFAYPFALPASASLAQAPRPLLGGSAAASHDQDASSAKLDLWYQLRKDLDRGYEVLGNFQDLAHSQVEYNETDVGEARSVCLSWQDQMYSNRYRYGYEQFARSPEHGSLRRHKHESKLFWGYGGIKPSKNLTGGQNLVLMVQRSQVQQMLDNYTTVMGFEHVYLEPWHTHFHLFRKLARSILSVLDFFPDMLPSDKHGSRHQQQDASPTGVHGLDKLHTGSSGPHLSIHSADGAAARRLSSSRHAAADAGAGSAGAAAGHSIADSTALCSANSALSNVQALFKNLGQVNNQVFAYWFYKSHGDEEKAEAARSQCDRMWADMKRWMHGVRMDSVLACLAQSLHDW